MHFHEGGCAEVGVARIGVDVVKTPQMLEGEKYEVRFAKAHEFDKVFELRHEVFYREFGAQECVSLRAGLDFDVYDPHCDHLIATHGNSIVGTYRILPVVRAMENGLPPYCATEFAVDELLNAFGSGLVELGRTCVAKGHRNGVVPRLLWKALLKHIMASQFQAIMGCVSVHNLNDDEAIVASQQIREMQLWHEKWNMKSLLPSQSTLLDGGVKNKCEQFTSTSKVELPPLMKAYAGMGAKVCGGPAMDREFGCVDFLMLAEVNRIPERYLKIFLS
jgi:putative hemolysin